MHSAGHGGCLDQLLRCGGVIETELGGWTDNPMIDPDSDEILYGGNFHAEPIGLAADGIALAIAETGAMSERRIALLIDQNFSKLPAFLTRGAGLDCGFMVPHVTAAALASENKSLSHPATVEFHSDERQSGGFRQHGHLCRAPPARHGRECGNHRRNRINCGRAGTGICRPAKAGPRLEEAHALIRRHIASFEQDRFFAPEIARAKDLVVSGAFLAFLP